MQDDRLDGIYNVSQDRPGVTRLDSMLTCSENDEEVMEIPRSNSQSTMPRKFILMFEARVPWFFGLS